ncbi:tyrosine-type recombinase/integrase [Paenibacillus sp. LjRoot153]
MQTKKCSCGASWSYMVNVGIDPQTGRRKQKKKGGFNSKSDAETAASIMVAELSQGTYIEEKNISFEKFAVEWLIGYQGTGKVKISTVRLRQHEISRLMPYFSKLKMRDITKKRYQDALHDLKASGYADNTIDGVHRTGRMIFKRAVELEVIKNDPTEYSIVPKIQKTVVKLEQEVEVPKYMEGGELKRFLRTAEESGLDGDYAIFLTLAYTGLRAGELCALKWRDIDFTKHTISITKTYYNPKNNIKEYQLLPPKTKTSKRTIDVDEIVISELEKLRAEQKTVKMRYRKSYHDHDFVFVKTDEENAGYPEYIKQIENRMARLLKISGLNPKLTPHSLRHTHTSLLAAHGDVSLETIMARLGHKDDDTTKSVYLHVTKPKKKEASHKFGELMRSL